MTSIETLQIPSKEKELLRSIGITTLEQIAMMNPDSLGLPKAKSDRILQMAWNKIAYESVLDLKVEEDKNQIVVTVKEVNNPVKSCIKGIFHIYEEEYGNANIIYDKNNIIISGKGCNFDYVIQKALTWKEILEKGKKAELEEKGITIDKDKIIEFAKKKGFEGFWKDVFEEIKGNEVMKQILTVSMFSTCEEPVHTLIIDDPGSVKTFAMDLISRNFNGDTTTIGANSTRAGLICNFATGELGALAYSDKKMVLLDELDKISKKEYPYMYELLWSGKTTVHAGNVHDTIKSHFIMIACANPKHGSFKGVPLREIGLPSPLISRFAFVIKTSPLRKEEMQELFYKKIHSSDFKKLPEYYNQWIKLARFHNPEWKVSEEKEKKYINDVIERIVARYKNSELRRDIRMADYIKRIPMAIARANFSDVTDEIIDKSFDLIIKSIESWS